MDVLDLIGCAFVIVGAGAAAFTIMALLSLAVDRCNHAKYLRERDKRRIDQLERRVKALEAKTR